MLSYSPQPRLEQFHAHHFDPTVSTHKVVTFTIPEAASTTRAHLTFSEMSFAKLIVINDAV